MFLKGELVVLRTHPADDNSYGIRAKKATFREGKN